MPGLSFLNPAFLGAFALAALPLLFHLIRKRRVQTVPWAAWEFLLRSQRQNRRRFQVERWLLLLLRVLIVCLIVLAFCRPILRALGSVLLGSNTRVHVLIVLDNSYSMGFRRDGQTEFERAKSVADRLLTRVVKPGDSVGLVLLSSPPQAVLKEPTFDLRKARERVRGARLSDRATDYAAAAVLGNTLLQSVRTPHKEVYWITDNQLRGWGPDTNRAAVWKSLTAQARVTWINVAEGARPNLHVEAPVFSRELVTPQAPVRIEALVHNHGDVAKNNQLVNLFVDGRAVGSARVDVPARRSAKASFVYLFEKAGVHTGSIALAQPDGLKRDDRAYFAAKVRDKLRVLVVNPQPDPDPIRDQAFYLTVALAPTSASEGGSLAVEPTLHVGPRLAERNLRRFDAVVVTGLVPFGGADRRALEEFVRGGGGLLLFPSPRTDAARVNAALGGSASLLPARLGAARQLPDDRALSLNPSGITHPVLAGFRNTSEINLGSARFTRFFDLLPSGETATTLCRFSGGQPAFVEKRFGQGTVILAASAAGVDGNTLPYKPAYVPLVHQLVAYLAAGPTARRNLFVDQPLSTRFEVRDANTPVRVTDPSNKTRLQPSALGAEGVTVRYGHTDTVGLYRIGLAGRPAGDAFAINLPPGESDLAVASERQTKAALGPTPVRFVRGTDDLLAAVRQSRRGTEIWRTLVLAVLPLLFLEGLLAQRWGRAG